MDDIRDHCLFGGAIGSLISILRLRIDKKTGLPVAIFLGSYLEVLATFLFNGAFAYLASPLVCDLLLPWGTVPKGQNACVALAGAIALASPWLFKTGFPILGTKTEGALRSLHPKMILERLTRLWDDKGPNK